MLQTGWICNILLLSFYHKQIFFGHVWKLWNWDAALPFCAAKNACRHARIQTWVVIVSLQLTQLTCCLCMWNDSHHLQGFLFSKSCFLFILTHPDTETRVRRLRINFLSSIYLHDLLIQERIWFLFRVFRKCSTLNFQKSRTISQALRIMTLDLNGSHNRNESSLTNIGCCQIALSAKMLCPYHNEKWSRCPTFAPKSIQ